MTTTTVPITTAVGRRARRKLISSSTGHTARRVQNVIMLGLTGLMTLLAIVPLVWIIGYVVYQGSQFITLEFLTAMPVPPGFPGGGVVHSIQGTLLLTLLASIFAIPPGILCAFYVAYNPNTPLGTAVRFGTDVLAGVPSIIIGLFCYGLVVKTMGHYSALAGGVAMGILMLPSIIRTTEEMIKLVPNTMREASLGLGAPEWKTSLSVVLPAAANGVITGILLGVARASGETAPLLFTALGNDFFNIPAQMQSGMAMGQNPLQAFWNLLNQPVDSLPLTLYKYASQPYPERVQQAWAVAFVLMLLVLSINIIARLWVEINKARMRG
jgi:phosphate transport system permease protein